MENDNKIETEVLDNKEVENEVLDEDLKQTTKDSESNIENISLEQTNETKDKKNKKKHKNKKPQRELTLEEETKGKKHCINYNYIFIGAFIILNLINAFMISSPYFVENLLTYKWDIFMIFNSIVGNISCLLIFLGIGQMIFKKKKSLNLYLVIISGFLSFLLFGVGIFCNYYGMMFGYEALENFGSDGGGDAFLFFVKSLPDVMKMSAPAFFLTLLIMLVGYIVYVKKIKHQTFVEDHAPKRKVKLGLSVSILGLLFLVFSNCIYSTSNKNTWYEYNASDLYSVQTNGFYSHYITETVSKIFGTDKKIKEDDKNEAYKLIEEQGKGVPTNAYTNMFKDKNLLLIQMESINNFLIGLELKVGDEWVEITPNMNELVRNHIYFDNFYTSVGMGNTSDAEFSAMTGLYPIGYTYTVFDYPDRTYEALPRLFEAKGYNAFSVHANSEKFYDRGKCHKQMYGFQEHLGAEKLDVTPDKMVHEWLSDEDMLIQAVDHMKEQNELNNNKSFCFAVTISNHTPFNQPNNAISEDKWFKNKENIVPKDLKVHKDRVLNNLFKGYLEYVCYTDFAIGKAIDRLKEQGLYEDTVVMMYGDHGIVSDIYDMFYNYPELFRNEINPIIKKDHKRSEQKMLELQMLNEIPLIISNPSIPQTRISLSRSEANLKSTISNLFGLDARFNFNKDIFADGPELCYSPKTELVYYDGIVVNTRSQKGCKIDPNCPYKVEDIVNEYRQKRDLNEKILNFDLLKKYLDIK